MPSICVPPWLVRYPLEERCDRVKTELKAPGVLLPRALDQSRGQKKQLPWPRDATVRHARSNPRCGDEQIVKRLCGSHTR